MKLIFPALLFVYQWIVYRYLFRSLRKVFLKSLMIVFVSVRVQCGNRYKMYWIVFKSFIYLFSSIFGINIEMYSFIPLFHFRQYKQQRHRQRIIGSPPHSRPPVSNWFHRQRRKIERKQPRNNITIGKLTGLTMAITMYGKFKCLITKQLTKEKQKY